MSPYSFTQAGTTYDAEDRLTGFARAATSGTPQLSQSWNLSAVGDWNSVTTNGTAQSRTHGPTHELLTAGGQNVTHDTKGNMLLIPASVRANSSPLVLTWDFDNRMVSADVGADSVIDVTHQYDALGRRVARTASGSTTVFVQIDQQTICDYVSGAAPASSTYRYLYGSYIDEPIVRVTTSNSETTWYHRNQQYSIVACTDSSGAATERYAYTAYGLPTITDGSGTVRTSSAIENRYTYTGREWDGTLGLYHYRARMYEATVGRFCSRDPIGYYDGSSLYFNYFDVNGVDPYGFLESDPGIGDGKGKNCQSHSISARLKLGDFLPIKRIRAGTVTVKGDVGINVHIVRKTCDVQCDCNGRVAKEINSYLSAEVNGRLRVTVGIDEEVSIGENWKIAAWGGIRLEFHATGRVSGHYIENQCNQQKRGELCFLVDFRAAIRGGVEAKIKYRSSEWDLAAAEIVGTCYGRFRSCYPWNGDGFTMPENIEPTGNCMVYARVCGYGMCWRKELFSMN